MAEPFKLQINPAVIAAIGNHVARAGGRSFDRSGFEQLALTSLDALALKARAMPVARALVATLPADVDHAAGLLEAALGPAGVGDELSSLRTSDAGLAGWPVWPLTEAVALMAADHARARGLQALHAMTQRLTAEFAIRPFLIRHPSLGFETLARWAHDPSAQVRRLVSEGSRPRLPWGLRLQALAAWGLGAPLGGTATLALTPARLTLAARCAWRWCCAAPPDSRSAWPSIAPCTMSSQVATARPRCSRAG